nr:MAG TPA: hypothetical protein [Caudoviricetes sp.]
MLYANRSFRAKDREMDWGTLHQITMGEHGRGRKLVALTCPADIEEISAGLHKDLTIGSTKSGNPRIIKASDDRLYMLLSAEGRYTRRGNGTIQVLQSDVDKYHVLRRGNGADGDAGRIGYWDCMVIEAASNHGIIKVRTGGAGYGIPSDIYIIHDGKVYKCTLETLADCCENLGIDIPCKMERDKNGNLAFGDDWIII